MRVQLPVFRHLWTQAKAENRKLREQNRDLRGDLAQLRIDYEVALVRASKAKARADALEIANDELRADLNSWMDKAVSSDG